VREREASIKLNKEQLGEITKQLDRIESEMMAKADSEDLEFKWAELVSTLDAVHEEVRVLKDDLKAVHGHIDLEHAFYEMTYKLEMIQDEVKELKDEVADVKSTAHNPAD
jgi:uncharacterized coiled-coil DUF342 family protein